MKFKMNIFIWQYINRLSKQFKFDFFCIFCQFFNLSPKEYKRILECKIPNLKNNIKRRS